MCLIVLVYGSIFYGCALDLKGDLPVNNNSFLSHMTVNIGKMWERLKVLLMAWCARFTIPLDKKETMRKSKMGNRATTR